MRVFENMLVGQLNIAQSALNLCEHVLFSEPSAQYAQLVHAFRQRPILATPTMKFIAQISRTAIELPLRLDEKYLPPHVLENNQVAVVHLAFAIFAPLYFWAAPHSPQKILVA